MEFYRPILAEIHLLFSMPRAVLTSRILMVHLVTNDCSMIGQIKVPSKIKFDSKAVRWKVQNSRVSRDTFWWLPMNLFTQKKWMTVSKTVNKCTYPYQTRSRQSWAYTTETDGGLWCTTPGLSAYIDFVADEAPRHYRRQRTEATRGLIINVLTLFFIASSAELSYKRACACV